MVGLGLVQNLQTDARLPQMRSALGVVVGLVGINGSGVFADQAVDLAAVMGKASGVTVTARIRALS